MSVHMQRAIENMKKRFLTLGARVEETVRDAVAALEQRDPELAEQVFNADQRVDEMEVEVEEECLKILALYQPMAADLRFIIAVLKINNDLERVGDLAVNVAERAAYLARQKPVKVNFDFHAMADKSQRMLQQSLDALVNEDVQLAHAVCAADDEVDAMNRDMYLEVQAAIRRNIDDLESLIHMLSISRHLERIADLATNIAEDVIYMYQGRIVRHRVEHYEP